VAAGPLLLQRMAHLWNGLEEHPGHGFGRSPVVLFGPMISRLKRRLRAEATRRRARRLLAERGAVRLELGAGDKKGVGEWVTIDTTRTCDLRWDLSQGLPFPDGRIQAIYSSHFFEHLSFREGQALLDECRRVLVPGGTFSICVPNARLYVEAYLQAAPPTDPRLREHRPAFNDTTRIDYLNYVAYMDGHHKYLFDEENLLHILTARGFRNARLRHFDPALDLQLRDFESIYAEAEK
jgi:predicted SAM-dependent methyltransferase